MAFAWWNLAACRDTDVELFFSEEEFSQRRARQLCAECRVRGACLEAALSVSRVLAAEERPHHDVGIFAGTTGEQRQEMICPGTVGQNEEPEGT